MSANRREKREFRQAAGVLLAGLLLALPALGPFARAGGFVSVDHEILRGVIDAGGRDGTSASHNIITGAGETGRSTHSSSGNLMQTGFATLMNWPETVLNLFASTGAAGGEISVSWTAPKADGSTGTAAAYQLRLSSEPDKSPAISETQFLLAKAATDFITVTAPKINGAAEQFTFTGFEGGTTYYFAVKARASWYSWSWLSNGATAQVKLYAPSFTSFTEVYKSTIQFNWTVTAPAGNRPGTKYRVLVSTAPDPASPGEAVVTSSDTYNLFLSSSGLRPNTTYYFRVAGLHNDEAETGYTSPQSTSTLAAQPYLFDFTYVSSRTVQLDWPDFGAGPGTLYRVSISTGTDPLNPLAGQAVTSSDTYNAYVSTTGLLAGTSYYFRAEAVNNNGVHTGYAAAASTKTLAAGALAAPLVGDLDLYSSSITAHWALTNGATGYLLAASRNSNNPPVNIIASSGTIAIFASVEVLTADTSYYLFVRANGPDTVSPWSDYPPAYTMLAYAPVFASIANVEANTARFSWSENGNLPGTKYRVLVSTAADPLFPGDAVVTASDTYNISLTTASLSPNTTYYFRVAGLNKAGVTTVYTAAESTRTAAAVPVFSEFTDISKSTVQFNWSASGNPEGTLYRVYASTAPDPRNPGAGQVVSSSDTYNLSLSSWGLSANTTYYFTAAAISGAGFISDYSAVYGTSTLAALPVFTEFTGISKSTVDFNWSANGNSDGTLYRVYASTAPDPLTPYGAEVTSSDTYNLSLSSWGLSANTTYYFTAAAINNNGILSDYSATASTSALADIPFFTSFTEVYRSTVQFNWDSGNPDGTLYRVYASTAPDPLSPGTGQVVTSSDTYDLSLSSWGLSYNTAYYFRAAAINNNSLVSGYSAAAGTSTLASMPVFSEFTGVTASAAQFNWTAPGNPDGTLYRVYYSTAADPFNPDGAAVTVSDDNNSPFGASGLSPNTTYFFAVAGVNNNGVETDYTAARETATLANIPMTVVSTFSDVSAAGFTAAWDANFNPYGTLYIVKASTAADFNDGVISQVTDSTVPAAGTSYSFSGLATNTVYYFRVWAVNHNGVAAAYADLGSTTTLHLPAPVTEPVAQVSVNSITAAWQLVSGATGYTLAASVNPGSPPDPVYASSATLGDLSAVLGAPDTPALALSATYYLFVRANGPDDAGYWAAYPATSTLANSPLAAGQTFSAITENSFSVSWDGNSNPWGTAYVVQVSTDSGFPDGVEDSVAFATAPAAGPGAFIDGLNANSVYFFRVRTRHNNGSFSDWLELGSAQTKAYVVTHSAGDGLILYGKNANTMPQFRTYFSTSNTFGAVQNTVAGEAGAQFRVKTSPLTTRQEAVAAYLRGGTLHVLCSDGANWTEEWTQAVGGQAVNRRFDVAYEKTSGDVMVLYNDNNSKNMGYRTKPGTADCGTANWSTQSSIIPSSTTGIVQWITMASDRRDGYDTIAALRADSNKNLSAMVWNGNSWDVPAQPLETSLEVVAVAGDVEDFDLDFESISGDVMAVWSNSAGAAAVNGLFIATAAYGTPYTWGTKYSTGTFANDATTLDLAANPNTDEMLFASIGNGGADMQVGYWSGSTWTTTNDIDAACEAPLAQAKKVAAGWISSGTITRGIVAYQDSNAANVGWYAWSGAFTAQGDWAAAPVFTDPQGYYDLQQDPVNKDRLMFTVTDGASGAGRLFAKRLIMDEAGALTWSNADGGVTALETAMSSPTIGGAAFTYWAAPPVTTLKQSAYRFFENNNATSVVSPLAAQDTLAQLESAGLAFRLRLLVHMGFVDLPQNGQGFKLQYAGRGTGTCETPGGGTPGAYTDVTGATLIAFNDNPDAAAFDNAALTSNANDPRHGGHTTVNQAYEELNNSTNTVALVPRNQDALWDFALKDNGIAAGTAYCFKLVKADGSPLNSYDVYPELIIPAPVYLNELYTAGDDTTDWVEFYNNTKSTPSLVGWKLNYVQNSIALGGSGDTVWTGVAVDTINAESTFTLTGFTPWNLNGAQSWHLKLFNNVGSLVDQVQWPAGLGAGQTFARISTGSYTFFEIDPTPTKNFANFRTTDAIKINEAGYGPSGRQFIELFNNSYADVRTLTDYALRNSYSSENGLRFRFTRKIYPRSYAVLDFSSLSDDGKTFTEVFGGQGLNAAGDFLALENPEGSTVDMVTWQSGGTYARYDYQAAKVPFGSYAPGGAAASIVRQPADGADTGSNSADFISSGTATVGAPNNNPWTAGPNTLAYPLNASVPQFLARKFPVMLTLGADSSGGAANNIVFQRFDGAADGHSPHLYRLGDIGFDLSSLAQQTTVQNGVSFNDQDGWPLVSSAVYKVTFNTDTGAASAPQIILDTVTCDSSVHTVTGSTLALVNMNNSSRDSVIRLEVSNNSPAGFNGLELTTVTFNLLDKDLAVMSDATTKAQAIFAAIMLVRDSTSGVAGVFESGTDISTIAYVPMGSISVDPANGKSTVTVPAAYAGGATAVAHSTQTFFLVFESAVNASAAAEKIFRVRFDPLADVKVEDGPGGLLQAFTPSAQVESSSVTIIAPAEPPPGTDWPYTPPAPTTVESAVGVYNGDIVSSSVYVASTDGVLRTLYSTGTIKWSFATSSPIVTAPDIQEEGGEIYLYFANSGGNLYKLRDDDSSVFESWSRNLGNGITARSGIVDSYGDKLYFGADNGDSIYRIYCINKANGNDCADWTFSGSVNAPIAGTMSIDDQLGVNSGWIGLEDGSVVSFQSGDASSNKGYVGTSFQPTPVMPIKTSPFVNSGTGSGNNNLYIASTNGKLYSRTSSNLTDIPSGWNDFDAGSPIYSSPYVSDLVGPPAGKYVFFGADNGKLYKVDAVNGGPSPVWTYQTGGAIKTMPVVVPWNYVGGLVAGEDYVYFGSDDGYIYAVNANSGALRTPGWPVKTGGPVRSAPVADLENRTLMIGSNDGKTYTLCIGNTAFCNP